MGWYVLCQGIEMAYKETLLRNMDGLAKMMFDKEQIALDVHKIKKEVYWKRFRRFVMSM